jgi:RNA polymerase sigma-70 factor (ECF subfamily)
MDPDEFRGWYESVAPDLHRYVTRICDGVEESDDVIQETFARLLGSDFTTDNPLDRRRYLFQIATNLVRDRRRWTRRWGLGALFERGGSSPEKNYTDRIDVQRALSRLPPRSQALLWLAYAKDMPHREIAEIVGVASTSVRVLLSRARKKLLENLERTDP